MALPLIENTIPELIINEDTYIGHFCHIVSVKSVKIEKKVLIADKVYISDNLRGYKDIKTPIIDQPVAFKGSVIIGENSWIGENACVIGSKIGKHCIVAANAVVTKDIPDFCVVAGAPAKIIKKYNPKTKIWEDVK